MSSCRATNAKAELAEAKRKLAMVHQGPGEVWRWQGDGGDDLDGLSCPVVMEASTLAKRDEALARIRGERDEAVRLLHMLDRPDASHPDVAAFLDRVEWGGEPPPLTRDRVITTGGGPAWTIEGDPSRGAAGQWRAVGPWRNERAEADGDARAGLGFTRDHPLCVCGHAIEAHKRVSSTNDDDCAYCDCVALRSEHEHCHCCHRRLPESWREPWCSLDCSNDPGDLE